MKSYQMLLKELSDDECIGDEREKFEVMTLKIIRSTMRYDWAIGQSIPSIHNEVFRTA